MKLAPFLALIAASITVGGRRVHAFCLLTASPSHLHRRLDVLPSATTLFLSNNKKGHAAGAGDDGDDDEQKKGLSFPKLSRKIALASTILTSSLFLANTEAPASFTTYPVPTLMLPPAAHAVEISSGAFVVQTNIRGTELVDVKTLLTTLIKNRKAVAASLTRVVDAVKTELNTPVWREIQKEVLQIEGDVAADFQVLPPYDITQTLRDLSKGKLNFILNGEIVNVAVDETLGKEQDELVIRVQGFKGVDLSSSKAAGTAPGAGFGGSIADIFVSRWQERLAAVQELWDTDLGLPKIAAGGVDYELTAGPAVVGGLTLTIATAYGASFAYYESQNAAAEAEAEEKRQAIKAKKAAAAAGKEDKEERKDTNVD